MRDIDILLDEVAKLYLLFADSNMPTDFRWKNAVMYEEIMKYFKEQEGEE